MRVTLLVSAVIIACGLVAGAQDQKNQAIIGYWRIKADTSTTNFLPIMSNWRISDGSPTNSIRITTINHEILHFMPNGQLVGLIEGIEYTGGTYKDTGDHSMTIKLYYRPNTAEYNYSISSNLLVLTASDGKHADYTNITAAVAAATNNGALMP
jgi:hypothetical protein